MKKILLSLVILASFLSFIAIVVADRKGSARLFKANVEALTNQEEKHGWNWPWEWGQGLTKDEREVMESCPTQEEQHGEGSVSGSGGGYSGSVSGSGGSSQSNPSNRHDIRCAYGYENCTPVDC